MMEIVTSVLGMYPLSASQAPTVLHVMPCITIVPHTFDLTCFLEHLKTASVVVDQAI